MIKLLDHDNGYLQLWRKKGDTKWHMSLENLYFEDAEWKDENYEYKQKLTQSEIDKYCPKFWPFAVPVKEESK